MAIEVGSGNVFQDLGFDNAEEMSYKADLVMAIKKAIKIRGLTQTKTAEICGTDQPTLSKVLRGNFDITTTDRLLKWLVQLGLMVRITIDEAPTKGGVQVCTCR